MKRALLCAGLLIAACGPTYAGNLSGQINARLTIFPSCGVVSHFGQYQMKCNALAVPQPKITESRILQTQMNKATTVAKMESNADVRLVTVEW
ncbi:hypothetical protein ACFFL1_11185 [Samsonia erythrinae]|uniref:Lipoprotein n=1 Tax=Samsonia erythrinae TaxID=160434 RepID=A0A4R3VE50_9GAMM|nr:hypothetical protein [Samsonia erythrinae]TCV03646.1 hypothetical protein EDC54_11441 [Samsonia erythrinae]